jgi:hypothetical protein
MSSSIHPIELKKGVAAVELFIVISALVVVLAIFGLLAVRFGYDSRETFDHNTNQYTLRLV